MPGLSAALLKRLKLVGGRVEHKRRHDARVAVASHPNSDRQRWSNVSLVQRDELRALQAPLKERYQNEPDAAIVTLSAAGTLSTEL